MRVNPFEMVVIIVAVVALSRVLSRYLARRESPDAAAALAARDQRIAELERRVAALEAVVSDQGYELKQQFRTLERG